MNEPTFVDLDIHPNRGIWPGTPPKLVLSAPEGLPKDYVGDDLRKATLEITVGDGAMACRLELTQAQLETLTMGCRRALLHMQGRL